MHRQNGWSSALLLATILCATCPAFANDPSGVAGTPPPSLAAVQRRAFEFFWWESDPKTGLTKDRATNRGAEPDRHSVASIAATGYALAALPVAVEHGWVTRPAAYARALTTLRFIHDRLPRNHGFYYHFVDGRSGERVWTCELSSCDTALLALGALVAGQYWHGTPAERLSTDIATRIDWRWMQTEGGTTPADAPAMGWSPEKGWLPNRWTGYSEALYVYILGLGTPGATGLTPATWKAWTFPAATVEGRTVFGGPSPLFMAQMPSGFFDLRGERDSAGRDWWTAWHGAHLADQTYCAAHPKDRSFAAGFWGLNASDEPTGYGAEVPADGRNDGTVSPTGMLAGTLFTPKRTPADLAALWSLGPRLWGRYGFADAFNLNVDWFDTDVIGIDLGMMLLDTENAHTGLIWRLTARSPLIRRGYKAAGFQRVWAMP